VAVGGQLDDTATTAATEDNVAPLRITAQRAAHVNLRSSTGTEIGTASAPVRTDPTGTTAQPVTDNGGSLTVDAPVGTPVAVRLSDGSAFIEPRGGDVAHDAVDSGNPIKVGGRASLNEPTAVADNDRVNAWFDQLGRQVVLMGHANPESPVTANGSAAGLVVISAPGAGVSLYICKGSLHNRSASAQVVSLREGTTGSIRFTANLAASGGGSLFDFGPRGWKLPTNTALVADIAAASADVNVTEYYIAP